MKGFGSLLHGLMSPSTPAGPEEKQGESSDGTIRKEGNVKKNTGSRSVPQFNKIREEIHSLLNRSKTSYSPTVSLRGVSFEIILAFCLWISFISGIQYTLECLQSDSQSPNKITSILPLGKNLESFILYDTKKTDCLYSYSLEK